MRQEIAKNIVESKALLTRLKLPSIYYDKKSRYYWARERRGGWTSLVEKSAIDLLKNAGLSTDSADDELSDVAAELHRIRYEHGVDYAGPLSGYKKGHYELNGRQVLVTRSYEIIKPHPGEWRTLATFLIGLLGLKQTLIFLFWLKLSYEALAHDNKRRPGQALFIAGPRDCGKSFLQNHVITPVLGGRACRCYRWLSGKTDFNGDTFEAEHLIIDDDVPFGKYQERMALGSRIKSIVASELQSAHYKFQDAFSVMPFWRLTASVNDSPEALQVLPPIDDTLEDKLIIFKAASFPMPMPTETQAERDAFKNQIYSELPAMLFRLTHVEIPESFAGRRFGLAHFHHPEIIQALESLTPEERLLGIVDVVLFNNAGINVIDGTAVFSGSLPPGLRDRRELGDWNGTAAELEAKLTASNCAYNREAGKLLGGNDSCGRYLKRLSKRYPERVMSRRSNSKRWWTITPPFEADDKPLHADREFIS